MQRQYNTEVNKKSSLLKFMGTFFKGVGAFFVLSIIIGLIYHQLATINLEDKYPPVGEVVDVGDYRLHMYATGKANGKPTIILESGLGTPSSYKDWEHIQQKLSEYTRVITYDRAGYGWSDSANNERTAEQIADDLLQLLLQSGEKGPYILVGHSFGGFTSQVFAHKYKEDVAGLVLIDSSHIKDEASISNLEIYLLRALKEIGIGHVLELMNMLPMHEHFVEDKLAVHFFHQHFYNSNQISELKLMNSITAEQVKQAQENGFGEIPMRVLSAVHEEYPDWSKWQAETATLSQNGKHLVVKDASHYIHIDQPEIVVETILDVMENF